MNFNGEVTGHFHWILSLSLERTNGTNSTLEKLDYNIAPISSNAESSRITTILQRSFNTSQRITSIGPNKTVLIHVLFNILQFAPM